jgi:hypothetical protein
VAVKATRYLVAPDTGQKTAPATKALNVYSGLQKSHGVTINDFSASAIVENQCNEFPSWFENISSVRFLHLL